jgi:hypothetical protein
MLSIKVRERERDKLTIKEKREYYFLVIYLSFALFINYIELEMSRIITYNI